MSAVPFTEFENVSFIRDFAQGYFNTLVDLPPKDITHPDQYQRGVRQARAQLRLWAPYEFNPAQTYLRAWEVHALSDAATERRTAKSLSFALQAAQRRLTTLKAQWETHELRAHPTKKALRSMMFRTMGEAKQLAKEQATRLKNPNPCVGCAAAVLCRDMAIACNQFFRYTTLPGNHAKPDIPVKDRKPTESSTLERMPPSRHWFEISFS